MRNLAESTQAQEETSKTRIVLLGTGTPAPDPEHSAPSTAIVVNGTANLVDFGTGVVRQAAVGSKKGVRGSAFLPISIPITRSASRT